MLVGYAWLSTDQDLALQRVVLTTAGCERPFTDTMSGAKAERPGLAEALDRSGRSLTNLIELMMPSASGASASIVCSSR